MSILLSDGRVSLRPMTPGGANRIYLRWFADPEVARWILHRPKTLREAHAYVKAKLSDLRVRFFSIYLQHRRVGTLKLEYNEADKCWWVGLMIGESSGRGKGVGPRAIWLATLYAFGVLGAKEVRAGIHPDNAASIRSFEKAGFRVRRKGETMIAWKTP